MIWLSSTKRYKGFPGGSAGIESAHNVGDLGLIPGLGRSPRIGQGNPLQYSCLENPRGQRSLVGYNPWGHRELDTIEQLSTAQRFIENLWCYFCCFLYVWNISSFILKMNNSWGNGENEPILLAPNLSFIHNSSFPHRSLFTLSASHFDFILK